MAPGVVILNDMNMNVPVAKERSLRNTTISRDFGITMCTLFVMLVAKNIGIKTVCIPKDNEKDLEEISNEITDGMEIIPVDRFEQVEKQAFAV